LVAMGATCKAKIRFVALHTLAWIAKQRIVGKRTGDGDAKK